MRSSAGCKTTLPRAILTWSICVVAMDAFAGELLGLAGLLYWTACTVHCQHAGALIMFCIMLLEGDGREARG